MPRVLASQPKIKRLFTLVGERASGLGTAPVYFAFGNGSTSAAGGIVVPFACNLKYISINASASSTVTIAVYKNGVATTGTVSLSSGKTASASVTGVSFAAGDIIHLGTTSGGAAGTTNVVAAAFFEEA